MEVLTLLLPTLDDGGEPSTGCSAKGKVMPLTVPGGSKVPLGGGPAYVLDVEHGTTGEAVSLSSGACAPAATPGTIKGCCGKSRGTHQVGGFGGHGGLLLQLFVG